MTIPLITVPIRKLDERLFTLLGKQAEGTLTQADKRELDLKWATKDSEQDNYEEASDVWS